MKTMSEGYSVHRFFDAYRAAFEALDVSAIADLFGYPCQIASDAGDVTVSAIPTREAWVPQLARLVDAYRAIGVRSAEIVELRATELTPRLAEAVVHWRLIDAGDRTLYDFDASYTLADFGDGMRITAIAHNETLRLRALLERG